MVPSIKRADRAMEPDLRRDRKSFKSSTIISEYLRWT